MDPVFDFTEAMLFLSLLTATLSLKMNQDASCDREGVSAAKVLQMQRAKTGATNVNDWMEIIGDGQQFYTDFGSNDMICIDNYGYSDDSDTETNLAEVYTTKEYYPCLSPSLERFGRNMYHQLVTNNLPAGKMAGKRVLEVGCGRGKGAAYLAQKFSPSQYIGLDLNHARVELASRVWKETKNLQFVQGNALELPFADGYTDIVINVESSFHYPNFPKFLSEVYRVLGSKGKFLWTAPLINRGDTVPKKLSAFQAAGFKISKMQDITDHVLKARQASLRNSSSSEFEWLCTTLNQNPDLWEWMGLPGSFIHSALDSRKAPYIMIVAEKN